MPACQARPPHCTLLSSAVKLVLVEEAVADQLVPRIVEGAKRLTVGM